MGFNGTKKETDLVFPPSENGICNHELLCENSFTQAFLSFFVEHVSVVPHQVLSQLKKKMQLFDFQGGLKLETF